MITLGITGGVGAGKSTVLEYLKERYAASILQADKLGHILMKRGEICYEPVVRLFGESILDETGEIDRGKIAAIVFSSEKMLRELNGIIHPAVKTRVLETREKMLREGCRIFVLEAALLLEEHYDKICDDLWYIHADVEARRKRLRSDRGYSDEKIDGILKNQLSENAFRQACRYTVDNGGDLDETYRQIDKRVESYGIV